MVLTALLTALAAHQLGEPLAPLVEGGAGPEKGYINTHSYIPNLQPGSAHKDELVLGGWAKWAQTLWKQALMEENLTRADQTSYYARQMVKFPRSWIRQLRDLSHVKVHNVSFVGQPVQARLWVKDFALANFTTNDFFEFTGHKVEQEWVNYTSMGPWDWTLRNGNHSTARTSIPREYGLDTQYFTTVCSSSFTLCPGGDHPYAMRFFDAIAGGSIPVVRSLAKDVDSPFLMQTSVPFHYYALEDGVPLVFRQDWVDENTKLFIKYCTFIEGDNTPPNWKPPVGMKEAIDAAEGVGSPPPA